MSNSHVPDANQVAKKKRLRRTPGVTIKTINQRVYPWFDDVERHVDVLPFPLATKERARKFAGKYRKDQERITLESGDMEPPCCSCRERVIWFCAGTGFECKQFKTYGGQKPNKETEDEQS